jgi:TPR repeat protein
VKGSKSEAADRTRIETMLASIDMKSDALPLPTPDATGDDLFRMGLLYSTGQGGAPLDYVSAHMLFNLAAMRGSVEAKVYRKELSQEMASEEVAEAQRAAREWLAQG